MLTRAQLLGQIMRNYDTSIAVAGTHGKTTTTSMLSHILLKGECDPTISVGGILPAIGGNIRVGQSETFLTEACEYTNSFLSFFPTIGIILNIDADHLDFFKDIDDIRHSFRKFAELLPAEGALIINADTPKYEMITENLPCKVITYGLEHDAEYTATDITYDELGHATFHVLHNGEDLGTCSLKVPGIHNVSNALASIAAGQLLDLSTEVIFDGLKDFGGTDRRFQYKGKIGDVTIIDDYAHHPTEIEATLHAAKIIHIRRSGVYSSLILIHVPKLFFRNLPKLLPLQITSYWLISMLHVKRIILAFLPEICRKKSSNSVLHVNTSRPSTRLKTFIRKLYTGRPVDNYGRRRRCKYWRTAPWQISYPHYPHVYTHFYMRMACGFFMQNWFT